MMIYFVRQTMFKSFDGIKTDIPTGLLCIVPKFRATLTLSKHQSKSNPQIQIITRRESQARRKAL